MKSSLRRFYLLIVLIVLTIPGTLVAQLNTGGLPYSFSRAIAPDNDQSITAEPPAAALLAKEDEQAPLPYRFAVNLPVDLGIETSGQWVKTSDGIKVWRLNVKSPGALALILYFDRFHIPEGGKIFVYNTLRTQLLGAFTSLNNNTLSTFATSLIYGDELTLEYNAPEGIPLPELHVSEVGHAYRGVADYTGMKSGFGNSGPCEVNVNCAEGKFWQNQKRSVTRITVKRGGVSVWCTGSLVNNVRNDGTPYVITADHCGKNATETDLSQWIFYFNYEGSACPDPSSEPLLKSITGATLVAHGGEAATTGSDFFLVLLSTPVPPAFNAYYEGWSRENVPASPSGVGIHHPMGDIKKISTYSSALQQAHWVGNPALAHWRVFWNETSNGHGTTEGGSSGSPLYNNEGLLVGTLTGGDSSCDSASLNLPDYFGMFSYSWDQNGTECINQLKCWLDPDNTGVRKLNGWSVGIEEVTKAVSISVFPNPVADQLNLKSTGFDGQKLNLAITDILGNQKLLIDWNVDSAREKQVNVSALPKGVYFVTISNGEHLLVRKFVKQ
ncbi:MAG: T9SS type A sorting domain-containing protein [Bacteroidales bacterium]